MTSLQIFRLHWIMDATTNPSFRCGLTIWKQGEKAGVSRFFRI